VNLEVAEKIAAAVLYEGYMLYPYRPSSVKNQQRWNFGVLYPRPYCEQQQGSDSWMMQTECLVKAAPSMHLAVKVRFLQIVQRRIGKLRDPRGKAPEDPPTEFDPPDFDLVERLEVGGRVYQTWQEAEEREHTSVVTQAASLSSSSSIELIFPAGREFEYLRDEGGQALGLMLREREKLTVSIEVAAEDCSDGVIRVTVRVSNLTSSETSNRETALMYSLVSAHTILGVENGEFASLLDPPPELKDLSMECENTGTWPVLVDEKAETVLSSPIILYDHPQIAPESAGDLFDSTEIDEILSLRILTLTDEEKREMRQSDERARQILERTESMPAEQFMKLHGVLRSVTPLREGTQ
jgi:hypothetical protein